MCASVFTRNCTPPPLIVRWWSCCTHRVHTIQTTAPSVVGFVSFETLDVLFSVDARFKRVFERNYFMLLIAWVKIAVPFLM
jgi:hypothetical protein